MAGSATEVWNKTYSPSSRLFDTLRFKGFELSRYSVYLIVVPRNWRSTEGKERFIVYYLNYYALKTHFAKAALLQICACGILIFRRDSWFYSFRGMYFSFFLSQGNKTKVPIGIMAQKTVSLLMHRKY